MWIRKQLEESNGRYKSTAIQKPQYDSYNKKKYRISSSDRGSDWIRSQQV